jgi:pimeloyl-ACP methyl ester carboxylesterase
MTNPHRISIGPADARIALARWGADDSCKPPALLSHGTGFVAEIWDDIARELASDYAVYALDRRGHGDSHKPAADRYHFLDFAEDVGTVIETLGLSNIYGIGHSAGATDLLLAAKLNPTRFERLFVMEPTVMDPHATRPDGKGLSDSAASAVQGAAPPGRIRQRGSRVPSLSGRAGFCEVDGVVAPGLHPSWLCAPRGWPGAAALHTRD